MIPIKQNETGRYGRNYLFTTLNISGDIQNFVFFKAETHLRHERSRFPLMDLNRKEGEEIAYKHYIKDLFFPVEFFNRWTYKQKIKILNKIHAKTSDRWEDY